MIQRNNSCHRQGLFFCNKNCCAGSLRSSVKIQVLVVFIAEHRLAEDGQRYEEYDKA